jgi:hypothetical protein
MLHTPFKIIQLKTNANKTSVQLDVQNQTVKHYPKEIEHIWVEKMLNEMEKILPGSEPASSFPFRTSISRSSSLQFDRTPGK